MFEVEVEVDEHIEAELDDEVELDDLYIAVAMNWMNAHLLLYELDESLDFIVAVTQAILNDEIAVSEVWWHTEVDDELVLVVVLSLLDEMVEADDELVVQVAVLDEVGVLDNDVLDEVLLVLRLLDDEVDDILLLDEPLIENTDEIDEIDFKVTYLEHLHIMLLDDEVVVITE